MPLKCAIALALLFNALILPTFAGGTEVAGLPSVQLIVEGAPEPVLSANEPKCGPDDIADAGLRAFRRFDGSIVAYANANENYPLTGPSPQNLHKICHSAYRSAHDEDPSHFNDQTWIAATWTDNGRDVMAIGHHEYHSELRSGRCQGTTPRQCRYGVLLHMISHDGGMTFNKSDSRPIAAVPLKQPEYQNKIIGYSQPSNIFEFGGWKYMFVLSSGGGRQLPGTCLMRAHDPMVASSWMMFDGSTFRRSLFDPYRDDFSSDPICARVYNLNGLVWSVLSFSNRDYLVATLTTIDPKTKFVQLATSTSRDAIHWSPMVPAQGISLQWENPCPPSPYLHYPSLINPLSSRTNFDDTNENPTLFLVEIKLSNCRFTSDRQLSMVKAHFVFSKNVQ